MCWKGVRLFENVLCCGWVGGWARDLGGLQWDGSSNAAGRQLLEGKASAPSRRVLASNTPAATGANPLQLLMYDEPTAGLDPVASTVVEDLIRSLHVPPPNDAQHQQQQHTAAAHAPALSGDGVTASSPSSNGSSPGGGSANGSAAAQPRAPPPPRASGGTPGDPGGVSSYIVVTHQHSTIRRAVDRLIFLHEGRVVWEGSVHEFDTTDEPIVRQFASGSLDGPIVYL